MYCHRGSFRLLSLLLTLSLLFPSVTLALEGAAGGEADGSEYGGGTDGGPSASEGSGSDYSGRGGQDSPSESGPGPGAGSAGAEATNQAAADAQTAAGYGMNGEVDVNATAQGRMDGTIDSDQVAMKDGTVQSLSAGAAAADAIAAAETVGGYVDKTATQAAYQNNPDMVPGTVVGSLTGTIGYPATVARAEIAAINNKAAVEAAAIAAINNSAATAYAATAKDLAGAINVATNQNKTTSVMSTDDTRAEAIRDFKSNITSPGTVSVSTYQSDLAKSFYSGPKGVAAGPNATGLNQAAKDAFDNAGKYSFDINALADGWVGGWVDQNGRVLGTNTEIGKTLDSLTPDMATYAIKGNYAVVADIKTNTLSVTDLTNGTKKTASLSDVTGINATKDVKDTPVGQQFGKTYSGPKGVPAIGLNTAAQYAARVYAGQQPVAVKSIDREDDARVTAGLAMTEDPQPALAMESIVNRALARQKSIRDIAASTEYQPVLDQALKNCGSCSIKSLTKDQLNQALDQVVNTAAKQPGFEDNVRAAKSMLDGTNVMTGLTEEKKGYVDFTNVDLTVSQNRASAKTISEVVAMRDDPNSTTLRAGKYNEQTFGIRTNSKAPDYTPQTTSFNAYTDIDNDVPSSQHTPQRDSNNTDATNNTPNTDKDTDTSVRNTSSRIPSTIGTSVGSIFSGPIGAVLGGIFGNIFSNRTGGFTNTNNSNKNGGGRSDYPTGMRLCPPYPISCQSGAAILALPSLPDVSSWFDWLGDDDSASESVVEQIDFVPVLITVNNQTREVEINRPDIIATLDDPDYYYTGEQFASLQKLMNETPILFGSNGDVIYSNGLYSPPVRYGEAIGQNVPEYVYTVEYLDENGNVINIKDEDTALPDNITTNLVRSILGNTSPFEKIDVASATYRLVDPKKEVIGDEYYDYVINLNNGDVRAITMPQFTSTAYMQKRFEQLGFRGNATDILQIATETFEEPEQGLLSQLFSFVSDKIAGFMDIETDKETITNLPALPDSVTAADIEDVFIYPRTDVTCPSDIEGYETGFMYTAIIKNKLAPDYVTMISDGRCGTGEPAELVTETAHHLESAYGVKGATYDSIVDRSFFIAEPTVFERVITNVYKPNAVTEPAPEIPSEPTTEPATSTPEQKPNLTNDITLEVKAVGSDGKILSDWSPATKVTISSDVQLYLRWDGSAYQQCLPFLHDGGTYALTRQDRAMLKGNTESEGFNLTERTAAYKIECGGQRNDEFGVDERVVEVVVE